MCAFFTLTDWTSTNGYLVVFVVVNPVRDLLDRKRSEGHLQSSDESMKTQTKAIKKTTKRRNTNTKHMPEKDRRRALDRENLVYRPPRAIRHPPRIATIVPRICTQMYSIYNCWNNWLLPLAVFFQQLLRALRILGFSICTVNAAWGVLDSVQSMRLRNVSSLLRSPQGQPQPCSPLPLLSSSAGVRTLVPLSSLTRPLTTAPFTYCFVPDPRVKQYGGALVPRDTKTPTILCHAVRPFFLLPPRPTFFRVLQRSRHMRVCVCFFGVFDELRKVLHLCVSYDVWSHIYQSMDQSGKVANNLARGQLNRKNQYFPVRVRA